MKAIRVMLAVALVFGTAVLVNGATATPDSGYPVGQSDKNIWGEGFSASVYNGPQFTFAWLRGSLKANIEGQGKSGGAEAWDDREWRGTISGATNPKWTFDLEYTVLARVATENHYYFADTNYSASAESRFRWWVWHGGGVLNEDEKVGSVSFQQEESESVYWETFTVEDTILSDEIQLGYKAMASGEVYTERADNMFVVSEVGSQGVDGHAIGWDGASQIIGGGYWQG